VHSLMYAAPLRCLCLDAVVAGARFPHELGRAGSSTASNASRSTLTRTPHGGRARRREGNAFLRQRPTHPAASGHRLRCDGRDAFRGTPSGCRRRSPTDGHPERKRRCSPTRRLAPPRALSLYDLDALNRRSTSSRQCMAFRGSLCSLRC
jgi:hypothetical protein